MIPTMKRIWLNQDNTPELVDPDFANRAALALASHACNGLMGRVKGDPVFEEVTEGRQRCWESKGKTVCYSSCADLAHWVLWNLLGKPTDASPALRDELRGINRQEAFGWAVGQNIASLVRYVSPRAYYAAGDNIGTKPGNIVLIGTGGQEHIAVVREVLPTTLLTFDYGQYLPATSQYCGKPVARAVTRGTDGRPWLYSGKPPGRPLVLSIDTGRFVRDVHTETPLSMAYVPDWFEGK